MEKTKSTPEKKLTATSAFKGFDRFGFLVSLWFERIAMVSIVGIIAATIIDVIGAKIFSKPMEAGTEVVYFLQIIAISGALAFTKIDGKHIRLEFVDNFPRILKGVFHFLVAVLGLGLFILLAWKSYDYGLALRAANEVTSASRFPLFPFAWWIALSCIPLCLVLVSEIFKSVVEVVRK
jgi:TRAP-type C4-dicarboxylate transport system permease small subunit